MTPHWIYAREMFNLAINGNLPEGFSDWNLRAPGSPQTILAFATFDNGLGPGTEFSKWDMRNHDGKTMAHVAAVHGKLPSNFTQWNLVDNDGWSVAHEYAYRHVLPAEFSQWGLTDNRGQTVADIAAMNGNLPEDFDQWDLTNESKKTMQGMREKLEQTRKGPEGRASGPKM